LDGFVNWGLFTPFDVAMQPAIVAPFAGGNEVDVRKSAVLATVARSAQVAGDFCQ
jgi:hypothetical protein